jgi:proteasome-associated ATPase
MLASIVDRAKKAAIQDLVAGRGRGLRTEHLTAGLEAELAENEALRTAIKPADWARVSGTGGEEPVTSIRTLGRSARIAAGEPGDRGPSEDVGTRSGPSADRNRGGRRYVENVPTTGEFL